MTTLHVWLLFRSTWFRQTRLHSLDVKLHFAAIFSGKSTSKPLRITSLWFSSAQHDSVQRVFLHLFADFSQDEVSRASFFPSHLAWCWPFFTVFLELSFFFSSVFSLCASLFASDSMHIYIYSRVVPINRLAIGFIGLILQLIGFYIRPSLLSAS